MGCDYYIVKILEVNYLNDNENEVIELDTQRCYFNEVDFDSIDSDDTDYEDEYYKKYLEVHYKPRVLFENNKWKNEKIKAKYEDFVLSKKISKDIFLSVIKKEIRYLR